MIIADLRKSSSLNYRESENETNADDICEDCGAELDSQQLCPNCDSEIDNIEEADLENDIDQEDDE